MDLEWYLRRLGRMTPGEVVGRVADRFNQTTLRLTAHLRQPTVVRTRPFPAPMSNLSFHGADGVLAAADQLLEGRWTVLGVVRADRPLSPTGFSTR